MKTKEKKEGDNNRVDVAFFVVAKPKWKVTLALLLLLSSLQQKKKKKATRVVAFFAVVKPK